MKSRIIAALAALVFVAGCATTDPVTGERRSNNTATGALIGAGLGAALGYLTNTSDSEEGRTNALIGAGIGALAGGAIGNYMDRQEEAFKTRVRDSGVSVRREGNNIRLIMPGDVTFATNSSEITPRFYNVLNDVGEVLNTFPATYVDVTGHADSTGDAGYNQALSERRASSVAGYLVAQGVLRDRFYVGGMGERAPITTNDTAQGRAMNRRVEILVRPHTSY